MLRLVFRVAVRCDVSTGEDDFPGPAWAAITNTSIHGSTRNSAHPGGSERSRALHTAGEDRLATNVSRLAAPELPAVFLRSTRLAHWHLDAIAVGVFGWSYTVLMPAFARDVLGMGSNGYGILLSASGMGAFVGSLVVATYGQVLVPRRMAIGGVLMFSASVLAFAFTRNFVLALVFLFISGFGLLLFFSTSNTVVQTIVPDEMRGRVMGVWSLVFGAMIPLGSLEAGAVAHWLGTSFALAFGAIVCAIAALTTLLVIMRRQTAES